MNLFCDENIFEGSYSISAEETDSLHEFESLWFEIARRYAEKTHEKFTGENKMSQYLETFLVTPGSNFLILPAEYCDIFTKVIYGKLQLNTIPDNMIFIKRELEDGSWDIALVGFGEAKFSSSLASLVARTKEARRDQRRRYLKYTVFLGDFFGGDEFTFGELCKLGVCEYYRDNLSTPVFNAIRKAGRFPAINGILRAGLKIPDSVNFRFIFPEESADLQFLIMGILPNEALNDPAELETLVNTLRNYGLNETNMIKVDDSNKGYLQVVPLYRSWTTFGEG